MILSIFKRALYPFISAYSALMNKYLTGHFLTTTHVLSENIHYNIVANGGATYNLSKFNRKVKALQPRSFLSFHIGCQGTFVSHSTMLIVGKKEDGSHYALFFDAQGNAPEKSILMQKEFQTELGSLQLETVERFYRELIEGIEEKPELLYSSSKIQADRVSCTAYSAAFFKEFEKESKNAHFDPEALMQKVANHDLVTFKKARHEVHQLARS